MKYEKPQLLEVGGASDVILGVVRGGYDLDGNLIMGDGDYGDELPDGPIW